MQYKLLSGLPHIGIGTIVGLIGLVVSYLVARNWLDQATAGLIAGIIALLTGTTTTNGTTFSSVADKAAGGNQ